MASRPPSTLNDFCLDTINHSIQFRDHNAMLGENFGIEWRDAVSRTPFPDKAVHVTHEDFAGSKGLRVETFGSLGWHRLITRVKQPAKPAIAVIRLRGRYTQPLTGGQGLIQPMWMQTSPNGRRDEINGTRARLRLDENKWFTLQGVFQFTAPQGRNTRDFIMNLPDSGVLDIAAVELSWLPLKNDPGAQTQTLSPFVAMEDSNTDGTAPLHSMAHVFTRLFAQTEHLVDAIYRLLTNLEDEADRALLEVLLNYVGVSANIQQDSASFPPVTTYNDDLIQTLVERQFTVENRRLETKDQLAITTLARLLDKDKRLALTEPRPLFVTFSDLQNEDLPYWESLEKDGLISGITPPSVLPPLSQTLTVPSDARLSPISLRLCRNVKKLAQGGRIGGITATPKTKTIWRNRFSDLETLSERTIFGKLTAVDGAVDAQETWDICVSTLSKSDPSRVTPQNAYAFVVATEPNIDTTAFTNIENCMVFENLDTLRLYLGSADYEKRHKPVVPISGQEGADYVVKAVQRHWMYGGTYVLTRAACEYDHLQGQVTLAPVKNPELKRLVMTSTICTLPVSELMDADSDRFEALQKGLYIPVIGFAIALPSKVARKYAWRTNKLAPFQELSGSSHRFLAKSGVCSAPMLQRLGLEHWRLNSIIGAKVFAHEKTQADMRSFNKNPAVGLAAPILSQVLENPDDWLQPAPLLDGFLVSLAQQSNFYSELSKQNIISAFTLMSQSPRAHEAAQYLAANAEKICHQTPNVIIPLFEFLTLSMPASEIDKVLINVLLKTDATFKRTLYRIAECIHRYGSDTALQMCALYTFARENAVFHELPFLRHFKRLLQFDDLPLYKHLLGSETIAALRAETSPQEYFAFEVARCNRAGALSLIDDSTDLGEADLLRWFNDLRAFSNEMLTLGIPISSLVSPCLVNPIFQTLAALIFRDNTALDQLKAAGALEQLTDQNAMAHSQLGDNTMLNKIIDRAFDTTAYTAAPILGNDIRAVYTSAQLALADLSTQKPRHKRGPLISVIMSAFNPDIPLMRLALDSLQNQTYQNIEVFVIDDASEPTASQDIRALVETYAFATLIIMDENSGPYVGRNRALELSKGDFIAIQDADDWAHPERFTAQLEAFSQNDAAQLVTTKHIRVDRSGKVQMEADFAIFGDGTMTSLFKRDTFAEIGTFAHVRSRGDVEMRERIRSYFGTHAIIELPLPMMYCLADSQTLSQRTKQNQKEQLQLFRSCMTARPSLAQYNAEGRKISAQTSLNIPIALRVSNPEKVK